MSLLCFGLWAAITTFFEAKWQDLIVTTVGTLLGAYGGVLLYKKQVADTQRKEHKQEMERHLNHMRWFSGILQQVINYANKQTAQLDLFIDRIKQEPSAHHQLAFIVSRSTERLVRANNEATFHAYSTVFATTPDAKKDYLLLLSVTDFITVGIARIKEVFEQHYTSGVYRRQLELKALLESTANNLSALLASMHNGGPNVAWLNTNLYIDLATLMNFYNYLVKHQRPLREFIEGFTRILSPVLLGYEHQLDFGALQVQTKNATVIFTDIERDSLSFLAAFSPSNLRKPAEKLAAIQASIEEGIRVFETNLK